MCVRKTSSGELTAVARIGGRKLRDSPGVQAGGGEPGRGRAVGQEVLFRTDSKVPGAEVAAWSEQGGRAVRDSFWKKIALVKKIHPYGNFPVSHQFGTGPEGKGRYVYSRPGSFGVKLKLPLWTKAEKAS